MKRVMILADTPGWIVDRITDEMIKRMPFDFVKGYYTQIATDEILKAEVDLVHYQNSDIEAHLPKILKIETPFLISCRSHRYPEYFKEVAKATNVHVCSPFLLKDFPEATYIPDGIFDQFKPDHTFTIGFAGRPDDYKGYKLVEEACRGLKLAFKPALEVKPIDMPNYYKSVDLMVVASENEGFNTIVMECLAINKPVITTFVGVPRLFKGLHFHNRTVDGIKKKIQEFYTQDLVKDYTWENICNQFTKLYDEIISRGRVSEN